MLRKVRLGQISVLYFYGRLVCTQVFYTALEKLTPRKVRLSRLGQISVLYFLWQVRLHSNLLHGVRPTYTQVMLGRQVRLVFCTFYDRLARMHSNPLHTNFQVRLRQNMKIKPLRFRLVQNKMITGDQDRLSQVRLDQPYIKYK